MAICPPRREEEEESIGLDRVPPPAPEFPDRRSSILASRSTRFFSRYPPKKEGAAVRFLGTPSRGLNAGAGVGRLVEYRSHRRQDGAIDFRASAPTIGLFSDDTLESLCREVTGKGVHDCPVEQSIGERKTGPFIDVSVANRFSLKPGVVGGKPNVF